MLCFPMLGFAGLPRDFMIASRFEPPYPVDIGAFPFRLS